MKMTEKIHKAQYAMTLNISAIILVKNILWTTGDIVRVRMETDLDWMTMYLSKLGMKISWPVLHFRVLAIRLFVEKKRFKKVKYLILKQANHVLHFVCRCKCD